MIAHYRKLLKRWSRCFQRGSLNLCEEDFNDLLGSLLREVKSDVDLKEFLILVDRRKAQLLASLESCVDRQRYGSVECKLILLKMLNLVISRYQYSRRDPLLIAKPFGLLVDPSNGCNLHCPGCVHSSTSPVQFSWPPGLMKEGLFRSFIDHYGPYAFKIGFFNYGEPFLNKLTPLFIRISKGYLLNTFLSTNLSLAIDADEIVRSGLDYMIVSMDGATDGTYRVYRRGGRFDLVIDNLKRLAHAKQKWGVSKPYIVWQFLLFEHNRHEMDLARKMAPGLGIDELHFMKPFSVAWDDPAFVVDETAVDERIFFDNPIGGKDGNNDGGDDRGRSDIPREAAINALYGSKWQDQYPVPAGRYAEPAGLRKETPPEAGSTCPWLYKGIVMDALGRILPCCGAPNDHVNLVCGQFDEQKPFAVYNSDMFVQSRLSFSDRDLFKSITENVSDSEIPYCSKCVWSKDTFFANRGDLIEYFLAEDLFRIIDDLNMDFLTNW